MKQKLAAATLQLLASVSSFKLLTPTLLVCRESLTSH